MGDLKNRQNYTLPEERNDHEEFGKGKKSVILCPDCQAAYYKKSWHHRLDDFKSLEKNKDLEVVFKQCPACQMIKNGQYEGRVEILNLPKKYSEELGRLVVAYTRRAFEEDVLDRLIKIKKNLNGSETENWEITLTENQLANKLASKIKDVFNKVKIKRSFSRPPGDAVEIEVIFE